MNQDEAEKAAREWAEKQIDYPPGYSIYYYAENAFLAGVNWERKRVEDANSRFAKEFTEKINALHDKHSQMVTMDGGRVVAEDE